MSETNIGNIRIALANCLVEKLWIMGLLKDSEKAAIMERNKVSFLC